MEEREPGVRALDILAVEGRAVEAADEEAKQHEHHAALKRKVGDGVSEQGLP